MRKLTLLLVIVVLVVVALVPTTAFAHKGGKDHKHRTKYACSPPPDSDKPAPIVRKKQVPAYEAQGYTCVPSTD